MSLLERFITFFHQWHSSSIRSRVVFSIMKIFVPAERRGEAVEMLRGIQGRLEICAEHLGSSIQDRNQPNSHILYAEQWATEEALYEHIRSFLYRRVLAVIELSNRTPEVSFYFVS